MEPRGKSRMTRRNHTGARRRQPDVRMQRIGEKSDFLSAPGRTGRDAHGTRLSEVGKRGREKKRGKKERRGTVVEKKKLVLPVTQNRDAAVRNKSRAPFTRKSQRGEEFSAVLRANRAVGGSRIRPLNRLNQNDNLTYSRFHRQTSFSPAIGIVGASFRNAKFTSAKEQSGPLTSPCDSSGRVVPLRRGNVEHVCFSTHVNITR